MDTRNATKRYQVANRKYVQATFVIYLLCYVLTSCSSTTTIGITSTPTTFEPTPEYLQLVTPVGEIRKGAYDLSRSSQLILARGVSVSIWSSRMDVSEQNRNWEIIKQRASLYLDGEELSDETLVGGEDGEKGSGLFRLSWAPDIESGSHEAVFRFVADSGNVIEYKWQFTLK